MTRKHRIRSLTSSPGYSWVAPRGSRGCSIFLAAILVLLSGGTASAASFLPINIRNADNGSTLTFTVGQTITLDLTNTEWDRTEMPPTWQRNSQSPWVKITAGDLLTPTGPPTLSEVADALVAGKYHGSTIATYTATAPGTVTLTAVAETRLACGTALQNCPRWDVLNRFAVTVVVQPATPSTERRAVSIQPVPGLPR